MFLTLKECPTIVDLGWIQFAHGLFKPQKRGRISSHVADKDQLAGSEACGLDIVRFSQGLSHRLFDKEMLAGFQTLYCVYAVELVGMTDQYHIHVGALCQHFRHVCEGTGDVELSRTVLHSLLRNIHYCRDLVHVRKEAEGRQMCALRDLPRTDDGDIDNANRGHVDAEGCR